MPSEIFVVLLMVEAGLGAVALVAFCLSLILFSANWKRNRYGGINTKAMKRAPVICLGIALPCFFLMPIIYMGLKPETIPCWYESAGEDMYSYDSIVEYQNEEYIRLDMEVDLSRFKQSDCKGYLKYKRTATSSRKGWTDDALYELKSGTDFPLLYVKRLKSTNETEMDSSHNDLYCRRQDQSAFLAACFEGEDTIYYMYEENKEGELEDKGICFPKKEMGITTDLWSSLYFLEETEPEYIQSFGKKPDYFMDALFMGGLFYRRFHLCYDKDVDKWYCFMDDEQGHPKEQIFKLPKKGQKYMNTLSKK